MSSQKPEGYAVPLDTPLSLPNCGMVAVAVATGRPFQDVADAFDHVRTNCPRSGRGSVRKFGKGWSGRTTAEERESVLTHLGVDWGRWDLGDRTLGTYARKQPHGWPMVVTVRGHAMALVDGWAFDQHWTQGVPGWEHGCSKRKLVDVTYIRK